MKKLLFIIIYLSIISSVSASMKENIIKKFTDIKNISFDFEQNINGKIENGNCIIAVSYTHLTLPTSDLV